MEKSLDDDTSSEGSTDRGNWSSPRDLFFTIVSWSVGLGNVWRFPYLCFRNGGGAFLVPYLTSLAIAGVPLFYLEMAIGQYSSLGSTGVWNLSPLFKGIGVAMVLVSGIVATYYNVIIAYILYFLYASMTKELPWTKCGNEWNTPACMISSHRYNFSVTESMNIGYVNNDSSSDITYEIYTEAPDMLNTSDYNTSTAVQPTSAAEEYFQRHVLGLSSGINEMGHIQGHLVICLLISWVFVFLCIIKGVKSMGKVVYFTALFPYAILTCLLVRGLTLPGSLQGIKFYLIPDWSKLATPKVWGDGAAQIFYSLGPCWGPVVTFGSYNKFKFNFHFFTVVSCLVCIGSSVYAGLCIFSVIGFMAHELNVSIQDVVASGPGLAFVVYPEAVGRMPLAPLWSILFFCMLLSVGIGSSFTTIQAVLAALFDEYKQTLGRNWTRRVLVTFVTCFIYFLSGLPMCMQGGIYLLNLIDGVIGTFTVMIVGFLEALVIAYVYGYNNLADSVEIMLGHRPDFYLRACICFFSPLLALLVVSFNSYNYEKVTYNNYVYPEWAQALGWVIVITNIGIIPLWVILGVIRQGGKYQNLQDSFKRLFTPDLWKAAIRPSDDWTPALNRDRRLVEEYFKLKHKTPYWHHEMAPLNDISIKPPPDMS